MPPTVMKYVYLIQSVSEQCRRYVGVTKDLPNRLEKHSKGGSPHTSRYRPWELVAYVAFENDERAEEFERYLKRGSGLAFAKKHLW